MAEPQKVSDEVRNGFNPIAPVARRARDPADERRQEAADDDSGQFLPVRTLRTQYLGYLTTKTDEIDEQQQSRRYYHGAM